VDFLKSCNNGAIGKSWLKKETLPISFYKGCRGDASFCESNSSSKRKEQRVAAAEAADRKF